MFSASTITKVSALAERIGVEPADLLAVAEVESGGTVSWNVGGKHLPAIRFEGHYFHRLLTGEKLKRAVNQGLAKPKAGAVANPTSYSARYDLLERAAKIDRNVAYCSTSWGLGQVMGSHWKKLGYTSVQELVDEAKSGVDGQIELMARYIVKFGLVDELQRDDFLAFALAYNGPAARKHNYQGKIKAAHARWKKKLAGKLAESDNEIAELQRDLAKLGHFKGKIDGRLGPITRRAIVSFQAAHGLNTDGAPGVLTREAITDALRTKAVSDADSSVNTGTKTTATGVGTEVGVEGVEKAADALRDSGTQLQWLDIGLNVIQYLAVGMILVGTCLAMYGLYKKFKLGRD